MKNKKSIQTFFVIILACLLPFFALAQTLSSPHYNLQDSEIDFGGGNSSSSNYSSRDSVGGEDDSKSSSTNFHLFPGLVPPLYPGVPGAPTLTNTGGQLYNALDFVISTGGNPSDVNYAIAISSDGFVTTNFVQANDTVGTSTVWQTYTNWGGATGQRITGLNPNMTYNIKVKARYGPDSETAYSVTASAATVNPYLTMVITGTSTGTSIAGVVTNVTTSAGNVAYGSLQPGTIKFAAQTVTVSTNALGGFTTTLAENRDLTKANGVQIPPVSASNAAPAPWPGGVTSAAFGYHTTANPLCTGTTNRFSSNNTYAAATTTPYEILCTTGQTASASASIVFELEIEALQPSGNYQNQITYVTTPAY